MASLLKSRLQITGADVLPVSVAEVKTQINRPSAFTADDALILSYIKAARDQIEYKLKRALITQTWELRYDARTAPSGSSCIVELPYAPLQSPINSIKYYTTDDSEETLADTNYATEVEKEPGMVYLLDGGSWPSSLRTYNAFVVNYDCGYGDAATDVPEDFRVAILRTCSTWYYNRENIVIGAAANELQDWDKLKRYWVPGT